MGGIPGNVAGWMKKHPHRPSVQSLLWALFILWTVQLSIWLIRDSILPGGLVSWDDYERCAWGANIWHDLRHADLGQLWLHTHAQTIWPFLHSWLTGVLFCLFSPSLPAARMLSLFAFAGSAILYLFFYAEEKHEGWLAGVFAWSLFITSPHTRLYAVSVMSELPGLFLVLFVLYTLPPPDAPPRRSLWPAIGLTLLFYYKYNFAFLTYAGVFLSVLFCGPHPLRRLRDPANRLLLGLPLLLLLLWLLPHIEDKVGGLFQFAVNNPARRIPLSLSSLLYYPLEIPNTYFAAAWVFPLVMFFAVLAFALRSISLSHPLAVCFFVHFLATEAHPMKDIRFMFIPMGLLFLLAGKGVCAAWSWAASKKIRFELIHPAAVCLVLFLLFAPLTAFLYTRPNVNLNQAHLAAIYTVVQQWQEEDRTAFLISHDYIVPPAFNFYLITGLDRLQSLGNGAPQRWNFLFLFQSTSEWNTLSPDDRVRHLRHLLFINHTNKVIVISSTLEQIVLYYDALFGASHAYAQLMPSLPEFRLVSERRFPRTALVLQVFALRPPGAL